MDKTIVLAGITTEKIDKTKTKMSTSLGASPGLPPAGKLSRTEPVVDTKKNLVVFVTAHIIDKAGKAFTRPRICRSRNQACQLRSRNQAYQRRRSKSLIPTTGSGFAHCIWTNAGSR